MQVRDLTDCDAFNSGQEWYFKRLHTVNISTMCEVARACKKTLYMGRRCIEPSSELYGKSCISPLLYVNNNKLKYNTIVD